ncbi:unnamed protein product, partial [Mesorhabditis belari]|uniref:Uncharacterized protein n=1 Tax=Mesorhabditis belari TaxID=2138241 RepID=A0AAF3J588_9BILA
MTLRWLGSLLSRWIFLFSISLFLISSQAFPAYDAVLVEELSPQGVQYENLYMMPKRSPLRLGKRGLMRMGKRGMMRLG